MHGGAVGDQARQSYARGGEGQGQGRPEHHARPDDLHDRHALFPKDFGDHIQKRQDRHRGDHQGDTGQGVAVGHVLRGRGWRAESQVIALFRCRGFGHGRGPSKGYWNG
jgi:hypothetical protein